MTSVVPGLMVAAWALALWIGGHTLRRSTFRRRTWQRLMDPNHRPPPRMWGITQARALATNWVAVRPRTVRHRRERAELVMALDSLYLTVAGGAPLAGALAGGDGGPSIGSRGDAAIAGVRGEIQRGVPNTTAIERWRRGSTSEDVQLVGAVLQALIETGASALEPLASTVETLRQRIELDEEISAARASASASGAMLSVLPGVGVLVMAAIEPATAEFLTQTLPGVALLGGSVALNAAGWWWMRTVSGAVTR